ncbi:MAG: aa3-type cytochrome c oxidase subunit IV [Pseudomonadota bacterium]
MAESKHEHGKMNIEAQERAFAGFIKWVTNGTIVCIVILILLAITGI